MGDDARARAALEWIVGASDGPPPRIAVVSAHPDDETLGAGGHLDRLTSALFVHVTDGAPRDGADARAAGYEDPLAYARARRGELQRALGHAGVPASRALSLQVPDQGATASLADVARRLAELLAQHHIDVVLTHAYEGGHPDHDATACAAHAAASLMPRRPALLELAGYHAGGPGGARVVGAFLPRAGTRAVVAPLGPARRAAKQARLAAHATQARVIDDLLAGSRWLDEEPFRIAPRYDFAEPPHPGPLHFDRFAWGSDGAGWRAAAVTALASLGLPGSP